MDSQTLALDLKDSILLATTPPKIAATLASISAFLKCHRRPFFSIVFPSLLRCLFGFDSISWLEIATSDRALSSQLFAFLSPGGPLFSSISSVDQEAFVKYIFPVERLPEWMRSVLKSSISTEVLASISPIFSSRIKEDELPNLKQFQLNIFEYYIFWYAYYPVFRGIAEVSNSGSGRATWKSLLENWFSQKPESSLYLRLLYSYLKAFVPKFVSGSMLNYSIINDESAYIKAEFVVQTFVQFWMVDNDFKPLPVPVVHSLGLTFPYPAMVGTAPPTPGLGDVLKLLVNYLHCYPSASEDENAHMMFGKSLQRPLYRFIMRSFLYCPVGATIKNSVQVFSLWMTYIEPWNISKEVFSELESVKEQRDEGMERNNREMRYTVAWRGYILENYLFYSLMVVHFLGFADNFIDADVGSVIKMVSEVLEVLCSSTELVALLRGVETAYCTRQAGSSSYLSNDLYKYIPSIHEQLQDWEDGISESDINGSFLHERSGMHLRIFSNREDGVSNLLQLLLLRAEDKIHPLSGDISRHLQRELDSVKAKVKNLFGDQIVQTPVNISPKESFTNQKDTVVAWLAVLLNRVSDWLNQHRALDGSVDTDNEIREIRQIASSPVLGFMRRHGIKINLRFLASKWLIVVISCFALLLASVFGFS